METEIDYARLLDARGGASLDEKKEWLLEELPYAWLNRYLKMTPRPTNVVRLPHSDFEYIFDDYAMLESTGAVPVSETIESRVVGVIGKSRQVRDRKTAAWLRGWIAPTEKRFGNRVDKGHFIAHSIGGGLQINIFAQRRDLNRGWSEAGKKYRAMEKHCFDHPGTLCFSRPIYGDDTATPTAFDFGLFALEGRLLIERFENSIGPETLPLSQHEH